jgi:Leucine-rich repeat (LRR) protein
MTQLTSLDISGISFITDDGLYNLTNLIKLNCSWNRGITDKSVSLLTKLEILDASATDLTDESICKLTKLTRLNASYSNKITDKSIITLKNLKEIKSYKNYAIKSINNRCGIKWNK